MCIAGWIRAHERYVAGSPCSLVQLAPRPPAGCLQQAASWAEAASTSGDQTTCMCTVPAGGAGAHRPDVAISVRAARQDVLPIRAEGSPDVEGAEGVAAKLGKRGLLGAQHIVQVVGVVAHGHKQTGACSYNNVGCIVRSGC